MGFYLKRNLALDADDGDNVLTINSDDLERDVS